MPKLLVATQNHNKLKEYRDLLDELPDIEWVALPDVGLADMSVEETGTTFEANAILKAEAYGQVSGLLTMADDSGLVVPALNGEPGVYSARYGGPTLTTDAQRYQLLLENLAGTADWSAYFVCVIAVYIPGQIIYLFEGRVYGKIIAKPRGTNGFGYDPVFELKDGRTMAELPSADKNLLSHRGIALKSMLPHLPYIFAMAEQAAQPGYGMIRRSAWVLDMRKSQQERLSEWLKEYTEIDLDIEGAAIITRDGLMMASKLPPHTNTTHIAAMAAALLSHAAPIAHDTYHDQLQDDAIYLKGTNGYMALRAIADDVLLLTLVRHDARLTSPAILWVMLSHLKHILSNA